jgi:hypothetical protein
MHADIHQALEDLARRPGARIVSLLTWTRPALLKKSRATREPCPYKLGVEKITERYGMIGVSYSRVVCNERQREGETFQQANDGAVYFWPDKLWNGRGEHVEGSRFLVRHKPSGKLYLAFYPRNAGGIPAQGLDRWRDVATGKNVDPAQLAGFLPRRQQSKRQETAKQIFWRTIALENVILIRCGEVYRIAA